MRPDARPRLTTLLTMAAVGVYLLVMVGATAALSDAAEACAGWPLCHGPLTPAVAVGLGHRVVAALVGLLVVTIAVVAWQEGIDARVQGALAVALVLYPIQVGLGALVATTAAAGSLPGVHLATGMVIFAALVAALAWQLETETAAETGTTTTTDPAAPDPAPGPDPRPPRPSGLTRVKVTAAAYVQLMKPRLMWLLCLVASAGMALAAGPALSAQTVVATLGGGVLAIGASGTFNQVFERDIDKKMNRTSDRPVATYQVPVRNAIAFGLALTAAAVAAFLTVNVLAAALGVAAIIFYSVVYTLVLKPNTVQNTVIGGAAGALPALIGWAAVTGKIGLPGLALAGVIFLWTPAHFYNLALAYREDYERGGFPMLPVVRGEAVTRKHILWYLAATLLSAGVLSALTDLGWLYAGTTVALGTLFLWTVVRLHRERDESAAFRAFHASNAYLGALLLAVVVDAIAV